MTTYTLKICEDTDGELVLEFTDAMIAQLGWSIGDTVHWTDNGDGTWTLDPAQNLTTRRLVQWIVQGSSKP